MDNKKRIVYIVLLLIILDAFLELFFGKDENYELTCRVAPDFIKSPPPNLIVKLLPEPTVSVLSGIMITSTPF